MTTTYSGNPSASQLDEVRFLIGDTDLTDWQLSDEEIAYLLTAKGSVILAALEACNALIAKYARLVTQSVGSISISYSDRIAHYQKVVIPRLKLKLCPLPYAGGTSVADKESRQSDTDWNQPTFRVGMHDRNGG